MRVMNISMDESPASSNSVRLAADISYDDKPGDHETLWFDVPKSFQDNLTTSGDPWLASLLPLACKIGEPLYIEGSIDQVLYESHQELMEWWQFWFPNMNVVPVHAYAIRPYRQNEPGRIAQFFSGGVDSFFTLIRHADSTGPIQVDDLLIGWGFDIPLSDQSSFDRVQTSLASAATKFDKRLIPFSSNIRETRFRSLPWGTIGHGNAMASVALILEGVYNRVLIPSTDGYRETGPWGSHATTDHYYSSSVMRIIHDGAAFSRFQKTELVATSTPALSAIRVCWRSQSDENCGKCEKCIRTMIALELCGVLKKTPTLAHATLDLDRVARVYCPHQKTGSMHLYYTEMLTLARQRGRHDLAKAISRALRRSSYKQPLLYVTRRLRENRFLRRLGIPLDTALRHTVIT
jgi:hypothetical protein